MKVSRRETKILENSTIWYDYEWELKGYKHVYGANSVNWNHMQILDFQSVIQIRNYHKSNVANIVQNQIHT